LHRYLPPLPAGIAASWLEGKNHDRITPGGWILDPFGASPPLLVEIARAGYRVLAAVNNPIARFLIELYADPPGEADLRAALADLASAPKGGERLEAHLRALYMTECAQCGSKIEAQAFVWERDGSAPTARIYSCPVCKDSGEHPATSADAERAVMGAASGLHRSRALERVAPLSDPDRVYAEEALAVYPPRAVYALFNLINRLDVLPELHRKRAGALLLAAFDQANGLWHHPPIRYRPKQLSLPQRYLEKNVWLALESAVESWPAALSELLPAAGATTISTWPQTLEGDGGICLFEGRLKDLAVQIGAAAGSGFKIEAVVTALPRPNQAFWTLSALWAGWLWGHTANVSIKSVLRRRRYDWHWHIVALDSALHSLGPLVEPGTPCLGLVGEAEPGFLGAALLAGELSGLDLAGVALRSGQEQAQINWERREDFSLPEVDDESLRALIQKQMLEFLRKRGEPASYLKIYCAAVVGVARSHTAASALVGSPADVLRRVDEAIENVLTHSSQLVRLGASSRTLEVGQWWLDEATAAQGEIALPLADRVEMGVVRFLQSNPRSDLQQIDTAVCKELSGLFTPDLDLVEVCLESYGEQDPPESELWRLRPQDNPASRRADLAEIESLLIALGSRLGFLTGLAPAETGLAARPPVLWSDADNIVLYSFHLTASGVLGRIVFSESMKAGSQPVRIQNLIVLPGGRAGLVEAKLRRDPRLRAAVERGWRFLKFRHVRWLAESETLGRENFDESLALDPLANRDPQMQLL
jgi:hypothetical protein